MKLTRNDAGFTLIELLIVIVIISIVATFALLSININQNKRLENITNQLVNLLNLAETEAMLRPATLGFALKSDSFQFYEYNAQPDTKLSHWQSLTDHALGNHPIPNDIEITLKIQNEIQPKNTDPKLIISESNDLIPFTILIGKKNMPARYKIIGKADGEIKSEFIHEEE